MSVIRRLHPWMLSMDDFHRWKGHPWMTFLHPWMTSTDDITQSMDGIFIRMIFGENCMHHIIQMRIPLQLL